MKKKNLAILLIFPFLISLFCIFAVNVTYNRIDVDISYIEWDYNDMEAFQISESGYLLRAEGVNQRYYKATDGGELVWSVKNKNTDDTEPCAEIVQLGGKYYLKALREGEVIVTCSNKAGNVNRHMTGVIYKDAAILLYPKLGGSQTNIDSTLYYGQYDHKAGTPAQIEMTMMVVPSSAAQELDADCGDGNNISFDRNTGIISITGTGRAELTLSLPSGLAKPQSFSFEIVEGGVNVYNYEDLLNCTNRSEKGEIVVLRRSFESVANTYVLGDDGKPIRSEGGLLKRSDKVECFGNYDPKTGKFSFSNDEIYKFTTTYNRNYIDQWNEFSKTDGGYSTITDQVIAGIRVQKDFYGNGFTINLHNLTYPYAYVPMTLESGEIVRIPQLTADNLFRGPLALYALGDPNNQPFLQLYGQDNVGMYVDGDNITVNDVNLKNCEFGDRLANLATTGTVLEVAGDNVTVKNSLISNGKNVVRSFSSMGLLLDNCMLSNSQNFLFLTGANEYEPVDTSVIADFYALDGTQQQALISDYIAHGGEGDAIINDFLTTVYNSSEKKESVKKSLKAIQDALNTSKEMEGKFKGNTVINDCYFYRSGISSICLETLFNSPFMETSSPSMISSVIGEVLGAFPYMPTHVSGTSYPVQVNISGNTKFYDYKKASDIDFGGLMYESVIDAANSILGEGTVDLDKIFPIKSMAIQRAKTQGAMIKDPNTGDEYVNIPITYYGGGLNLSEVTFSGYENSYSMGGKTEINLLETYVNIQSTGNSSMDMLSCAMRRVVPAVAGFEPFAFSFVNDENLYGQVPRVEDLSENLRSSNR